VRVKPRPDSSQPRARREPRIDSLERHLEEANTRDRENRRLLAATLQVRQLEGREADAEEPPETTEGSRSWWRRLLGR
jgi:hypothetical protein